MVSLTPPTALAALKPNTSMAASATTTTSGCGPSRQVLHGVLSTISGHPRCRLPKAEVVGRLTGMEFEATGRMGDSHLIRAC